MNNFGKMKTFVLVLAALLMTTVAAAQTPVKTTLAESKLTDNWYIGVNGGMSAPTTHHSWMSNLNPEAALRIGRYLTPVFGLAVEGQTAFDNKPGERRGTFVQSLNTSLLATVNLSNFFGGYGYSPRRFELVAVGGMGWGRNFGTGNDVQQGYNSVVSKLGLDLTLNLGSGRAWQLFLEPAIVYTLNGPDIDGLKYNFNRSAVQLNLGLNYKLPNSNATHNFVRVAQHDQYAVDRLNQELNELRYDQREKEKALARDARTISELRKELEKARQMTPVTFTDPNK